ncbi:hypothetical protein C0995_010045 [Termitomyces sp. Mi166|nr:hypothetical protein C0995_010045 [Termitomyces sp. Mi166\
MPLFKRKEQNLIPPVVQGAPRSDRASPTSRSPYHSNASTYIASRDGDPYNAPSSRSDLYTPPSSRSASHSTEDSVRDKYSRSNGVGDLYSRGTAEIEKDRNELFAGYNPQKSGSGRFFDGQQSGRSEPSPGEENEEDIEGIKQQTRFTKQESVNSTRNALRMAREAEETARNTLTRLEMLANTERHLDVAKGHSARAEDNTNELKQLNRSIFRPVIVFNKEAKRAAQEAKVQARYEEEREEREKTLMDIRESQNRLGRAATYGRGNDDEELIGGGVRARFKTAEQQAINKEQRKRYQFEATASDDELEDELDNNLDEISEVSKRLKALGMAMGTELDNQNSRIDRIEGKAVRVEQKLHMNTQRNAAILRSLGLHQPLFEPLEQKPKATNSIKKRRVSIDVEENTPPVAKVARVASPIPGGLRRSTRTSEKKVDYTAEQQRSAPLRMKDEAKPPRSDVQVRRYDPFVQHPKAPIKFNRALKRSCETGEPVRVVRGFKLQSKYAPSEGYRYDGLYKVEKAWIEEGLNPGKYLVCKFAFKRLPDQPPLPIRAIEGDEETETMDENERAEINETNAPGEENVEQDTAKVAVDNESKATSSSEA